jgi:hypothetical protein
MLFNINNNNYNNKRKRKQLVVEGMKEMKEGMNERRTSSSLFCFCLSCTL